MILYGLAALLGYILLARAFARALRQHPRYSSFSDFGKKFSILTWPVSLLIIIVAVVATWVVADDGD